MAVLGGISEWRNKLEQERHALIGEKQCMQEGGVRGGSDYCALPLGNTRREDQRQKHGRPTKNL